MANRTSMIVLLSLLAAAPEDQQPYTLFGSGFNRCRSWLDNRAEHRAALEQSWVLGLLSGFNFFRRGDWSHLTDEEIFRGIDSYCREHPDQPLENAALTFGFAQSARMRAPRSK